MALVTVWDGEAFNEIEEKEAKALQKEDKVQICDDSGWPELKARNEFTGYSTRQVKAETKTVKPKKKAAAKKAK